jgi:hypothetical protein
MRDRIALILIVAAAAAGTTWLTGWWGAAVVAAAAGAWRRRAWPVALGVSLGWAGLLLIDAIGGRMSAVARTVGAIMQVPGVALVCVTLLFAAALAWSAATVAAWTAETLFERREATEAGN